MPDRPPVLQFCTASLDKRSGGIAALSRQIVRSLQSMAGEGLLRPSVHVLEGTGPDQESGGVAHVDCPIRWYSGDRFRFALGSIAARADYRLFDHVGLARAASLLPGFLAPDYMVLIHGIEMLNGTRADYIRAARAARKLIANSEYTARRVRERHDGLPDIRICLPGMGEEGRATSRPGALPADLESRTLLIVGRLAAEQRHKGHDHLIEAMPMILDRVPDARLIVAGEGDDRGRLERKAWELGLADRVVFTGWVNESQRQWLYEHCAVFVLPSEGDGFGLVFLEAMRSRMPCVGLGSGAAAEIFGDGGSGVLVDRDDRAGMATTLADLLVDENRREQLGEAAYQRYQTHFTHDHFRERLQEALFE